ncbi:hypothetical protein FACS189456_7520 [Bacteroidia bacterium]|nr:hypothetical protein FACS189456_7520 [Bacteroidia bacterium]
MIRKNLQNALDGKAISLDDMASDVRDNLATVGDDVMVFISPENIGKKLGNFALNSWNNINFKDDVLEPMLKDLGLMLFDSYVKDQLITQGTAIAKEVLGDAATAAYNAVAATINMKFENIANSEIAKAVSFDPSAIKIVTPVADISGYVRFVENDPVWGKSWQAGLNAEIKVPKPFVAYVHYINGTVARPDESTYKYWILDVGVSQLGIMLSPMPLVFDAAKGKVYQHVLRDPETNTYAPNETVRFGLNFEANFFDKSGGKAAFFDIGLGATIMDKGFILDMHGKVDAANTIEEKEGKKA